jgi:hypothetical protein
VKPKTLLPLNNYALPQGQDQGENNKTQNGKGQNVLLKEKNVHMVKK